MEAGDLFPGEQTLSRSWILKNSQKTKKIIMKQGGCARIPRPNFIVSACTEIGGKKHPSTTDELSIDISKFVLSTFWEIKILFQELHFAWPMGLAPTYQLFGKSVTTTG